MAGDYQPDTVAAEVTINTASIEQNVPNLVSLQKAQKGQFEMLIAWLEAGLNNFTDVLVNALTNKKRTRDEQDDMDHQKSKFVRTCVDDERSEFSEGSRTFGL